jgi:hypothetical protein
MKPKANNSEREKEWRGEGPQKRSKKIIRGDFGKIRIQYPAKVGYHGTDEENDLSPEE